MSVLKNVLSIDMDYIMAPCIQLYNDQWTNVENRGNNPLTMGADAYWSQIEDLISVSPFLCFDGKKLEFIKNLVDKTTDYLDADKIYFGKEHDSILTFLCQDKAKVDEVYNVYNIDHHHDMYYSTTQKQNVQRFNYAGMSNWVWYLYENKKLNRYFWINTEKSRWGGVTNDDLKLDTFFNIKRYWNEPEKLNDLKFDYIYICKSENYVLPKYYNFFNDIVEEVSAKKKTQISIDYDRYCINDKSRNPITVG